MIKVQMHMYSDPLLPLLLFGEYTEVVYITYTMATWDSPDIYARALGPVALGLGHINQANPLWPWYNYYMYTYFM